MVVVDDDDDNDDDDDECKVTAEGERKTVGRGGRLGVVGASGGDKVDAGKRTCCESEHTPVSARQNPASLSLADRPGMHPPLSGLVNASTYCPSS